MSRATLYCGDALDVLAALPPESVQCCVTSPPYWGLRDLRDPAARLGWRSIVRARLGRDGGGRNARSVWTIATVPYPGAHFATFPPELARRCLLAGSRPGDTVLDPFGGAGTVAATATGNGRSSIYIDLKPEYLEMARARVGPMLCDEGAA